MRIDYLRICERGGQGMINLLKKLCTPIAVSGNERVLREIIKGEIEGFCDKIYTDNIGNLIAEKNGKKAPKSKIMIAAHMDEVGIIITNITSDGLLKFDTVGGIDERIFPGKKVAICSGGNTVYGTVGVVPMHLLSKEERGCVLGAGSLYIDIGASSKEEAQSLVSLGDVGVLEGEFSALDSGKIVSRALDNRCGCAVLISLLKSESEFDFTAVFTVQEEVGCRGALAAAENIRPSISLILDTTTACDIDGVSEEKTVCNLGCGGVVSFMDKGCIYDKGLFNTLIKVSKENNIPMQLKRAVAGANDSSSINKAAGGVRCASLCLPCRYLHSPSCQINVKDLEATISLAKAVLPEFAKL